MHKNILKFKRVVWAIRFMNMVGTNVKIYRRNGDFQLYLVINIKLLEFQVCKNCPSSIINWLNITTYLNLR